MMWVFKLLSVIKNMYVDSSACFRVKWGESEGLSGVRQGCIMSPCLFNVYLEVKMGMRRRGVRFLEDRREWRLPPVLYADDLVLCGESEEDLRAMVEWFADVCRRRGLKVNTGKSMVMVLNGE